MPASARAKTAHWAPLGPKTRPFRHGFGGGEGDADPPLPRGTVVAGCYRLDKLIGQGGMGQVYAAEHLQLGTRVALKLLRRGRTDSESAARLRQEAKAASRIGHRAIVQVVDFDRTSDGLVYLAMELLRGESFEDWLERPGSMPDGVRWLAEAARGLDAAHSAGIVHRDVKPDNVFLHRLTDGKVQPKLLDFGLAKATAADLTQVETQAGTLLGTPYYLAPERALGRPLDPRADLYSLGIMLYETLTGNVPFVDDSFMGILALHIKSTPLDPRQAAPDRELPDTLCRVTLALLAKDPHDRPASGAAVAELLDEVVAQHAARLATIKTGPREVSGPSDETTTLATIAERPTAAPQVPARAEAEVKPFAATLPPDADAARVTTEPTEPIGT
ncbi:MAG: serine/threonine protein kinase, partial [Nannocystaceae bacterium]|nr:serine/threonine protein kinase [Nannocystaceae bacterium]